MAASPPTLAWPQCSAGSSASAEQKAPEDGARHKPNECAGLQDLVQEVLEQLRCDDGPIFWCVSIFGCGESSTEIRRLEVSRDHAQLRYTLHLRDGRQWLSVDFSERSIALQAFSAFDTKGLTGIKLKVLPHPEHVSRNYLAGSALVPLCVLSIPVSSISKEPLRHLVLNGVQELLAIALGAGPLQGR